MSAPAQPGSHSGKAAHQAAGDAGPISTWLHRLCRPSPACAALTVSVVWLPSLLAGFLHDDYEVIREGLAASVYSGRLGHVALLSLTGQLPALYRCAMVLTHVASALVVYGIVRALRPAGTALAAAVAFGASYLAAGAVCNGPHAMAGLAVLSSVLLLLRLPREKPPGPQWLALQSACVVFGALFSEETIAIPLLVGLYGVSCPPRRRWLLGQAAVLLVLALACLAGEMALRTRVAPDPGLSVHSLLSAARLLAAPVKIASAAAFFGLSPWYQLLRLVGMATLPALALSALLVVSWGWRRLRLPAIASPEGRVVVWLAAGALACLAPLSLPGTTEDIPTMAGRYLYPAWGMVVVVLSMLLRFGPAPGAWTAALSVRGVVATALAANLVLVGLTQARLVQRCRMDREIVEIASDALSRGEAQDFVLVGQFPFRPPRLPSPSPGPLGAADYVPDFYEDMLRLRGWEARVTSSRVAPAPRPGQLVIDLGRLRVGAAAVGRPSGTPRSAPREAGP